MSKSTFPGLVLLAFLVLVAVFALTAAQPARAETFHHCTGFIDTLPTTISTRGTWCLRKDVATGITSGNAILVAASNVTIDCNGFRLSNSVPSATTSTIGIYGVNRSNVAIRNCGIVGFYVSAYLQGGDTQLVEDNRTEGSRGSSLWIDGEQSIVRRNRVSDVGVGAVLGIVCGITSQGDGAVIADNHISLVTAPNDDGGEACGIFSNGLAARVEDNHINTILAGTGGAKAIGIHGNTGLRSAFIGNTIINGAPAAGYGFYTSGGTSAPVCIRNVVRGFTTSAYEDCIDGGGNYSN